MSLLLALGCASNPRDAQERAQLHLAIGSALLSQGKYPAALGELLVAEELDPKNSVIQNHLALAYFVRERFDLAEKHVREALRLNPDYTEARNNLGRILIERKQVKDAIKELKLALEDLTYSSPYQIELNLGYAYFLEKRYAESNELIKRVIQIDKENCFALTIYGKNLAAQKKYQLASQAFDSAIRQCKEASSEDPLFQAGFTYFQIQEYRRSKARLKEYLHRFNKGKYSQRAETLLAEIEKRL